MPRVIGWVLLVAGAAAAAVGVLGLVLDWGGASDSGTAARARVTTTSSTTTTQPAPQEEVAEFVEKLAAARRSNDSEFLLGRLHPVVIERYGLEQCRAFVAGIGDPTYQLQVTSIGPPEAWPYVTDGLSTTIADAVSVGVTGTLAGRPSQAEFHFARIDSELRYFVDCGTPASAS